jgi:hypothetical protein
MKEGDIVIVPLPQANGMVKNRPAVILREMPPFRDPLVCGLSTQLRQYDGLITRYDHHTGQLRDVNPYPNNPMGWGAGELK